MKICRTSASSKFSLKQNQNPRNGSRNACLATENVRQISQQREHKSENQINPPSQQTHQPERGQEFKNEPEQVEYGYIGQCGKPSAPLQALSICGAASLLAPVFSRALLAAVAADDRTEFHFNR